MWLIWFYSQWSDGMPGGSSGASPTSPVQAMLQFGDFRGQDLHRKLVKLVLFSGSNGLPLDYKHNFESFADNILSSGSINLCSNSPLQYCNWKLPINNLKIHWNYVHMLLSLERAIQKAYQNSRLLHPPPTRSSGNRHKWTYYTTSQWSSTPESITNHNNVEHLLFLESTVKRI
jgi:hypothetical protein